MELSEKYLCLYWKIRKEHTEKFFSLAPTFHGLGTKLKGTAGTCVESQASGLASPRYLLLPSVPACQGPGRPCAGVTVGVGEKDTG